MQALRDSFASGLAALADDRDMHMGAFMIAAETLKTRLPVPEGVLAEWSDRILETREPEGTRSLQGDATVSVVEAEAVLRGALFKTCSRLHFIAHDLLFGAYALMALRRLEGPLLRDLVGALADRIESMGGAPPGIFHGYGAEEITAREAEFRGYDPFANEAELVSRMMDVLRGIEVTYPGFGFRFLLDRKFPVWFSRVEGEFPW